MRKLVLAIAMLFCLGLWANGFEVMQKEANPQLYQKLRALAKENIKELPKVQKKAYTKLLKSNDDILMNYLLAYEESAKLAEAKPEDVYSNYCAIKALIEKEGMNYSYEFFLSYIAQQSVSDERIEAYRVALLADGLDKALAMEDELDRYRETASWCVEKLFFMQTSGRDQTPLDITEKSLVGRCEEMQILFVAAARTVGLPARPASTPWWAHMDNNHAWAEVYLDGAWHYTGDMDAAYYPDQTWFSGLVDKTVLILARGSLADESEEVLQKGRYEATINSTQYYSGERTRKVSIEVADEEGNAIKDALISVMVFNWGSLRPLTFIYSDEEGKCRFSSGRGDFFVSAYKDGKMALAVVKASEEEAPNLTLTLKEDLELVKEAMLVYPANEMEYLDAPQSYKDDIERRKELRQSEIDSWAKELEELFPAEGAKAEVLKRSFGNFREVIKFFHKYPEVSAEYLEFLQKYDAKFLWQADFKLLEAHYRYFLAMGEDAIDELIAPVSFYEELPKPYLDKGNWELYPKKLKQKGKEQREILAKVGKYMKKKHKVKPAKALKGLLRLDISSNQKYLSSTQYQMQYISALKANGIAAAFTRLPEHIYIHLDGDWQLFNTMKGRFTSDDAEGEEDGGFLELKIVDEEGMPINVAMEQVSINKLMNGVFYSLNSPFETVAAGTYRVQLDPGKLYLNFGYRVNHSRTAVQLFELDGSQKELTIVAKEYPRSWQKAPRKIVELISEELMEGDKLVLLGNYDLENSLRLLAKIESSEKDFVFYGFDEAKGKEPRNYQYNEKWQNLIKEDVSYLHRTLTLYKDDEGWKMYEGMWDSLPK